MGFKHSYVISVKSLTILLLLIVFSTSSCKKSSLIPAYIYIEKINLETVYEYEGTASHKITDAWVYIDDDLQGIYELPALFPVLKTGKHSVKIRAGIKINGIAKSRGYYPFYQFYETTADFIPEKIDTIKPTVRYYPDKIQWKEDFESAGLSLKKFGLSDTNFIQIYNVPDVFEGFGSAMASLDANYDYLHCVSEGVFNIPQTQTPVFLELNYKTDVRLAVGLYAVLTTGQNEKVETMIINPNTAWNKIYVNLTPTVNSTTNTTGFRVYFEALKPDSLSTAKIYLDNIKLLYTK